MKSILSGTNTPFRIALLVVLVIYVGSFGQFLSTPYFWDELGVYSQAAFVQFDNHLSLLPSSVPPEYSRGHPLLCAFMFGAGFKLLGPHVWVAHSLSLLFAILVAVTVYYIGEKYHNGSTGLFAVLVLLAQPIFAAQSILLLPEMLLALCVILALAAFIDGRRLAYFIFCGLALMTKESAIVLPFAVLGSSIVHGLFQGSNALKEWRHWLVYLSPLLVFVIFLFIQRVQNGWFFLPLHASLISFDAHAVYGKMAGYYEFIFFKQGRSTLTVIILLGVLWFLFNQLRKRSLLLKDVSLTVITLVVFIVALYAFSIVNFYMNRYLLALFPALCLLGAIALDSLPLSLLVRGITIVLVMYLGINCMSPPRVDYDDNLAYLHVVKAEKKAIHFLEEQNLRHARICSDFQIDIGLKRVRAGYLTGEPFDNLIGEPDDADYVCLFYGPGFDQPFPKQHSYTLWKSFSDGFQQVRIYKVIHPEGSKK